MKSRFKSTNVISWSQTEIDGLEAAPLDALRIGAAWSWFGQASEVNGGGGPLILHDAIGEDEWRAHAARSVRKLVRMATPVAAREAEASPAEDLLQEAGFILTNGAQSFTATLIELGKGRLPLIMFLGAMPPKGQELWVVDVLAPVEAAPAHAQGVVCFTPGTRMLTPRGITLVEDLRPGDLLQTKDNGAQPIEWIGRECYSGARLFVRPDLRPVRLRSGSMGIGRPDHDLVVSPDHRLLVQGSMARSLFNTTEVLVAARDLVDGRGVVRDLNTPSVDYIHVLMPRHEIIFANGLETESFHPADADLSEVNRTARRDLFELFPCVGRNPFGYGGHARRVLQTPEAAILRYAA